MFLIFCILWKVFSCRSLDQPLTMELSLFFPLNAFHSLRGYPIPMKLIFLWALTFWPNKKEQFFGPGGFACATRGGVCNAYLAIVITIAQSLFFFLFPPVFCFLPTSGKLPRLRICFPQYFGITRRYMHSFFLFARFFFFSCPALGHGRLGHR